MSLWQTNKQMQHTHTPKKTTTKKQQQQVENTHHEIETKNKLWSPMLVNRQKKKKKLNVRSRAEREREADFCLEGNLLYPPWFSCV